MSVYRQVTEISHPVLGGTGTNTWHLRTDSIDDAGDAALTGLVSYISAFYSAIQTYYADGTVINVQGTLQQVDSGGDRSIDVAGSIIDVSGSYDPLPAAVCLVAGWRTASGGRSGRGRTFLNPFSRLALQENGSPTEDARNAVVAAGQDLIDSAGAVANGGIGVWSVKDQVLRDFTGIAVRNTWGSLRSRRD